MKRMNSIIQMSMAILMMMDHKVQKIINQNPMLMPNQERVELVQLEKFERMDEMKIIIYILCILLYSTFYVIYIYIKNFHK